MKHNFLFPRPRRKWAVPWTHCDSEQNFALHLWMMFWAIIFPHRFWSIVSPRYLTWLLLSMGFSLQVICNSAFWLSFFLGPNKIDSVLPKCKDSLFAINHSCAAWSSVARACSISAASFPLTSNAVSSAYSSVLQLTADGMSLTYIRNNMGPKIDPLWNTTCDGFSCWQFSTYVNNLSPIGQISPQTKSMTAYRDQWLLISAVRFDDRPLSNAFCRSSSNMPV